MPPKPASIMTGGMSNIERKAWGMPSEESTTGAKARINQAKRNKHPKRRFFKDSQLAKLSAEWSVAIILSLFFPNRVRIPSTVPQAKRMATGQNSSGLPERLWRQL